MAERVYLLDWLFERGSNPSPSTVIPGGDFRDSSSEHISEPEIADFFDVKTGYKAFSRFQIKYRVRNGLFFGSPIVLKHKADVGDTKNPCTGTSPISSQTGPNNRRLFLDNIHASWINDASPNKLGVRAFDTLMGAHLPPGETPRFWENVGSQIRFSVPLGTLPSVIVQPYPTFHIFYNGRLKQVQPEVQPSAHFYSNPYPFGDVPCTILGTIPGGRCGDASSPREPTSRIPPYIIP